jgi:hypothetical protein
LEILPEKKKSHFTGFADLRISAQEKGHHIYIEYGVLSGKEIIY